MKKKFIVVIDKGTYFDIAKMCDDYNIALEFKNFLNGIRWVSYIYELIDKESNDNELF